MKKQRSLSRRGFLQTGAAGVGVMAVAGGSAHSFAQAPAMRSASGYPVLDTVDVLVVGGGPAGIGAALGAARAGAKTLLIENHSFFGGVAAWMLGMEINQVRPGGKPRSAVHELLIEKLVAYGDQAVSIGTLNKHELWCNVEYLKVAVLDALEAAGARYLVHVRAVDAVVERNRVTGVVVGTKRGLMVVRAKAAIDCTGDADVSYYAGAETMMDPKSLMPMTLALALTNIDKTKVRSADISSAIRNGRKKYPLIPSGFLEIRPIVQSSSWFINHSGTADMGRIDATDPVERTKAECASRRQALQMAQALRGSDNPNINQIEWVAAGPQLSVRESRRVKGLYVITEQDARAGQKFEDVIAWRSGLMDPGGEIGGPGGSMKTHDVPYRALVPEKLDGLLVAGRCISTSHVAAAAAKSMGNCMATGHAAGLAASLAAQKGIQPRDVKVPELQDKLRADGVDLEVTGRDP
ncbi:MAG: FAD-dependent oxidoreductase [Acidobacteriia bacterium]|nr:FAD-dependent oxidoreductase [Terriglobia bacterium]